jgi:murein DD-endopeptidase MepM/ murein hydrolase activator NlpD/transcriptional regulator with XRE-family HTH domain
MLTVQALRRTRGLTLVDVALISGIPARTLGAIECGVLRLDHRTRNQLAQIFAVAPDLLQSAPPPPLQTALRRRLTGEARATAPIIGAALATAAILGPLLTPLAHPATPPQPVAAALPAAPTLNLPPATQTTAPVAAIVPTNSPPTSVPTDVPTVIPTTPPATSTPEFVTNSAPPTTLPTTEPTIAPIASFALAEAIPVESPASGEPYGCPLVTTGRIIITQGYGVGTHAPAEIWGGVDLAIVRTADGPGANATTRGTLVFTPHAGVASVALESWPGGNYVRVANAETGWSTAYAHLDQVFVTSGQQLEPGTVIGTVGSTGWTTGPHLHYEVWRGGINQDPTPFLRCG